MSLIQPPLRSELLAQLLELNYHAFLHTIKLLLQKMGYEDVRLASRTGYVGRNKNGGYDLTAYRSVPGGRRPVIVQVKQYSQDRKVFRRMPNELRGVGLDEGAAEVILITTGEFSPSIPMRKYASAPQVPIRFIDGTYLCDLLALHRIGVTKRSFRDKIPHTRFELQQTFFNGVDKEFKGIARPRPGERRVVGVLMEIGTRKRRM